MFDPKKAGEEADRMITELNQPAAAEDQGVTEDAITTQDIDTTEGTTEVAVSQEPHPEAPPSDAALAELKKQLDAAEQRWKVLQGMIDKKDDEIEQMRTLFAQMQTAPQKEDQGVASETNLLTGKDSDDFGADLVDMVKRAAAQVASQIVKSELSKFKPVTKELEADVAFTKQSAAQTAHERFTESLTSKVADWEGLNTDPGFLNWLNQGDEFAGVPRLALLRDAFSQANVGRVAKFFNAYKEEAGLTKKEEPVPQPTADVKKFIAPGKSRNSSAKVESGSSKQWSRADISKLYDDKMKGRISQSDFDSMERDLFKAQSEGRIAA